MSSTRASRMGTPVLLRTATGAVEEADSAPLTWWSPVSRWDKTWVVPAGATGPSFLAKPSPYQPKILKYVRVSEKRRPSFTDDPTSPFPEVLPVDEDADRSVESLDDTNAMSTQPQTEVDVLSERDMDNDMQVDETGLEEPSGTGGATDDDIDEREQIASTQSIVQENVEVMGPDGDIVTARDVENALSHPLKMSAYHDHYPRHSSPRKESAGSDKARLASPISPHATISPRQHLSPSIPHATHDAAKPTHLTASQPAPGPQSPSMRPRISPLHERADRQLPDPSTAHSQMEGISDAAAPTQHNAQ
ncbi:hypothetical protein HDU87_008066 [Geranomyces variabilis]|uniref:Uncharacterized protein n=1 Tax=Geranomyces variabilis TaxID=109894 RepID=A0AAD5TP76_9FUNG|nr:hypothetical protein HDU87_008066 [Geranomyces variabilis]